MRKIVSSIVAAGVFLFAVEAAVATQAVKKPVAQETKKSAAKAVTKPAAAAAKKTDSKKAGSKSAKKPDAKTAKKTDAKSVKKPAKKADTKVAKKKFKLPKLPPPSLTGIASVYHYKKLRRGASGEVLKFNTLIAAHRTFRFGTKVKVTNRRNGKSVVVRIVDRGPYIRGRVIDLSPAAARQIGLGWSVAPVTLAVVSGKKV